MTMDSPATEANGADPQVPKNDSAAAAEPTDSVDPSEPADASVVAESESGTPATPSQPNGLKHELNGDGTESAEPETKKLKTEKPEESSEPSEQKSEQKVEQKPETTDDLNSTRTPDKEISPNTSTEPLPLHQKKHIIKTLKAVRRLKDAGPFLVPVDPVKLNIPTYFDYIKKPMDLSTMEKKANADEYHTVEEVVADFAQMVDNAVLFNGAQSIIGQMAKNVQASFEKHMLHCPPRDLPSAPPTVASKSRESEPLRPPSQRHHQLKAPAEAEAAVKAESTNSEPSGKKSRRSTGAKSDSPAFALQPSGIPTIRRESTADGRPKREIHPPRPKDIIYADVRPRKKKYAVELKFCGQVLKELMSKKYESFSFPFLQPVDPVALNCPSYFSIIKEPMDLSTIQKKFQNNQYENAKEFESDVKLMFSNCYKFNPEGSPVYMMGKRLEAVFDKKWLDVPVTPPSPPAQSYSSDDESSEYEEVDEASLKVSNQAIEYLERQLEVMKNELARMKREQLEQIRRSKKKKGKNRNSTSGNRKKSSMGNGGRSSKKIEEMHVSYDMKKEISDKIAVLPEKKLNTVISIIQAGVPDINKNGDEEIELDMDQLDNATLWKLYNFVVKDSKNPSAAPAVSASRKTGAGKKRSRHLTKAEENRQIEELKQKLAQFENAEKGKESDSSDEEDDFNDSSSEEE